MDIFADNIAFTDNISPRMGHQTNVIQGTEAYSRQLWSLRFHAALLFSKSHVGGKKLHAQRCNAHAVSLSGSKILGAWLQGPQFVRYSSV